MEHIALTGFSLFGSHTINPTAYLVDKFSSLPYVEGRVLPVSYGKSAEAIKETKGKVLVMTGLADGRKEITLERFAYNQRKASIPDIDGVLEEGGKILENGEERLETEVDVEAIVSRLKREGIEASLSLDPGRYVCNNIYYTDLSSSIRPSLFVHFPQISDMSEEMEEKALDIIIGYLRETYLSER